MGSGVKVLAPSTRLAVSSVLLPSKRHYLDGMPALLQQIGINRWIVNPLLRIGRDHVGGLVDDPANLFREIVVLQEAADRAGIQLTVDDEFDRLNHDVVTASQSELQSIHVRTLPPLVEIFRLAPSGQCSSGEEILKEVTPDVPRWRPGTAHAGDFLKALSRRMAPHIRRTA
jgi:hypothetical protein